MKKPKYPFGDVLRRIRERRKLTLKEVAASLGVSESLISQIERNRVSPSLDTLLSIADVLEVDLEYLFRDLKRNKDVQIIRKAERSHLSLQGVDYQEMARMPGEESVEVLLLVLEQNKVKNSTDYGHQGYEVGVILEGRAEFEYGNKNYELERGDSISFSSELPHTLRNIGNVPLKALWVLRPGRVFQKKD